MNTVKETQTAQSPNKAQMRKTQCTKHSKYRELEERTKFFAKSCRDYVKRLNKSLPNIEYGRQLIRSSGSQAANYIEANEALGKKDFIYRIKICRKEAKESCLWIELTEPTSNEKERQKEIFNEGEELRKIFSAILDKSK